MREPVIIGVAEEPLSNSVLAQPGNVIDVQARAAVAALGEAGLSPRDVDGLLVAGAWGMPGPGLMPSLAVGEYLGIKPRFVDTTNTGGAAFESHVAHAAMAIEAGHCDVALITYGSTQRSQRSRSMAAPTELSYQYDMVWGLPHPLGGYALAAARHMHEFGTTPEHLAEIAVAARAWAALNPAATKRDPLTVANVLESPLLCEPLHALDCCLVTDGAGALVMTSAEHARAAGRRGVFVRGWGESHTHLTISSMSDLARLEAARRSGDAAFAMAGIDRDAIDVAELYDSFTITALMTLEALGFCEAGEGGRFVSGGRIAPGGAFPMNTSGGGLSYCHPGMYGIFLLIEAVRQIRGECGDRQVADVEYALAHGSGGTLSSGATCILSRS